MNDKFTIRFPIQITREGAELVPATIGIELDVEAESYSHAEAKFTNALRALLKQQEPPVKPVCEKCGSTKLRLDQMVQTSYPPIYVTVTTCKECGHKKEDRRRGNDER